MRPPPVPHQCDRHDTQPGLLSRERQPSTIGETPHGAPNPFLYSYADGGTVRYQPHRKGRATVIPWAHDAPHRNTQNKQGFPGSAVQICRPLVQKGKRHALSPILSCDSFTEVGTAWRQPHRMQRATVIPRGHDPPLHLQQSGQPPLDESCPSNPKPAKL